MITIADLSEYSELKLQQITVIQLIRIANSLDLILEELKKESP
jgi:hypothetical protein